MRREIFYQGGYYHIYNRGVDGRKIFLDKNDYYRFLLGLDVFNRIKSIGSLRDFIRLQKSDFRNSRSRTSVDAKLIKIIAYCILPNHFHLIIKQVNKKGVSKFLQKFLTGYTKYFNIKYKRLGPLFQGGYKCKLIDSDEYLIWLSAYINCNAEIHKIKKTSVYQWSSYRDYIGLKAGVLSVEKNLVLNNFKNKKEYQKYCQELIPVWQQKKEMRKFIMESFYVS